MDILNPINPIVIPANIIPCRKFKQAFVVLIDPLPQKPQTLKDICHPLPSGLKFTYRA
jgi:hypothetical protein